jgi:predicted RNA-binding protein with RPS1 domain
MLPGDTNTPRGTDLRKAIPAGSDVKVKIVEADRGRIRVSIKAALQDEERQAYKAYQQQANSTSVGVSLADKLRKLNLPR